MVHAWHRGHKAVTKENRDSHDDRLPPNSAQIHRVRSDAKATDFFVKSTAFHCRPVNNRIDSVGCMERPRVFRSCCPETLAARAFSRTG